MSQPTRPTLFSVATCSAPASDWRATNSDVTKVSDGVFIRGIFVWSCALMLFVWLAGLIHIESAGIRLTWSEMTSIRQGSTGGHTIMVLGSKNLGAGPYVSDPLTVVRCIAAVFTIAGSVILTRFLVLPLTWDRKTPMDDLNTRRAGANIVCANIMKAQVIWWIALTTLIFVAAIILPENVLITLRMIGRVSLAVIVLLGPALFLLPQINPLRAPAEIGAVIHSRWIAALIQLLISAVVIIAMYLIGAALSMVSATAN